MRILVTGASGFIGRHLMECLARERHAVRALVHGPDSARVMPAGIEVVQGDVRDASAMKAAAAGVDTVFHLAAKVHDREEGDDHDAACHAVNVQGTRNVLDAAVAGGVKRLVFFSSVKAMGEGGGLCLDETAKSVPQTPYGQSKLEAEGIALEVGRRAGLHVACLRLPLVYGPGVKGNLFRMIQAVDRGIFPPPPEIGNRRSMVYVADVAHASVLAAETPVANGQCYIVTDGNSYSTRELYVLMCRGLGKAIPSWHAPVWILRTAAVGGDVIGKAMGKRFVFDSNALDKLIGSAWYSSERISRELGYRPTRSFEDALPEMIAWYRTAR